METLSDPKPGMLAAPRFDDGAIDMKELLRRLAEQVVNAVMNAEADQLCGGGANSRNGYRERGLATCVGTLTPRIPKLRNDSFFPDDVIERYQRVDRALAAVAEMYATGEFFSWLKGRGFSGVWLVTGDKCARMLGALEEVFPGARHRRCTAHFYRNLLGRVPVTSPKAVARMLKAIHAQESREACGRKPEEVADELEPMQLGTAARTVSDGFAETLACAEFPPEHWRRIGTNNGTEHINRKIRRRTRVAGTFPDGNSALMLVMAGLKHIAGHEWGKMRYLDMSKLQKIDEPRGNAEGQKRTGPRTAKSICERILTVPSWSSICTDP